MPFFDAITKFAESQSVAQTGAGGTLFPGTYELDFEETILPPSVLGGAAGVAAQTQDYPDKGMGSPLVVRFEVNTAVVGGTSIAFCLCFDTTTRVPSSAPTIVMWTAPILVAALTIGCYIPEIKIPDQHARFCNVGYYIIGTTSAGNVTAYLDIATGLRHR
jgi:hypothetical protein